MKKTFKIVTILALGASMMMFSGCGGSGGSSEEPTGTQTETPATDAGSTGTTNLAFSNISNADLDTGYTTNVVTIAGVEGTVVVKTNIGSLVVNGVDTEVAEYSVVNGDTVAVKVTSSGSYGTAVSVRVEAGGAVDFFSVTTKKDTATTTTPGTPTPTPEQQCLALGGFWDGTQCH